MRQTSSFRTKKGPSTTSSAPHAPSGMKGTGAGRGREPQPVPRNKSSCREGSGLGSMHVTPEGGRRITRELHRTAASRGVKRPSGLARWKGSHCNPQIAQSTSRWISARSREASAGSDRGSPEEPRGHSRNGIFKKT